MTTDTQRGDGAGSVLIVDDDPKIVRLLTSILRTDGYEVHSAGSGASAIEKAIECHPDLVLLDIRMPDVDGFNIRERMESIDSLRSVPVIFVSGLTEVDTKVKAFRLGASDYISKPFEPEEICARVRAHLRLYRLQRQMEQRNQVLNKLVEEQVREISDAQISTIFALAKLAESRDDDTGAHIERVRDYCRILADQISSKDEFKSHIDSEYVGNIYNASPLHDIGKVGIPDAILLKPGKLTPEEFDIMKTHTVIGADTLQAVADRHPHNLFVRMGIAIARSHHEKWDGSGYPDGLAGEDIPLSARIMAVADVYDALRTERCYKPAFPHEQAAAIIREGKGAHFDPRLVDAFDEMEAVFEDIRSAVA